MVLALMGLIIRRLVVRCQPENHSNAHKPRVITVCSWECEGGQGCFLEAVALSCDGKNEQGLSKPTWVWVQVGEHAGRCKALR